MKEEGDKKQQAQACLLWLISQPQADLYFRRKIIIAVATRLIHTRCTRPPSCSPVSLCPGHSACEITQPTGHFPGPILFHLCCEESRRSLLLITGPVLKATSLSHPLQCCGGSIIKEKFRFRIMVWMLLSPEEYIPPVPTLKVWVKLFLFLFSLVKVNVPSDMF